MLNMPSVSTTSNLVSRPLLVAEAVRPVAPLRAIEPTTAISKERSRTENKSPETSLAAAAALYTAEGAGALRVGAPRASEVETARVPEEDQQNQQPPAQKSEIQKAMEAQIKELLSNVWRASAKAVDFLLQRDSEANVRESATMPGPATLMGKNAGKAIASENNESSSQDMVVSYTPKGARQSEEVNLTGQLLDVLA